MTVSRRWTLALVFSVAMSGWTASAWAQDRAVFAGCVTERGDTSITLNTSGGETIVIDTSWLKPTSYDTLTEDCLTFTTLIVEGRYVAESVEAGDESNDVHGVSNNASPDRENRGDDEREKEDDD